MNALPVESLDWVADFKSRVELEQSIFRILIRWGLAESALDIQRIVEERLEDALHGLVEGSQQLHMSAEAKTGISELLRNTYLKMRDIPRRRVCQERLHNALLTGFAGVTDELVQACENYLEGKRAVPVKRWAA